MKRQYLKLKRLMALSVLLAYGKRNRKMMMMAAE
jgi:hypothetical protein